MVNFGIRFANPWLLFLFIPAAALAFWFYFRLSKKYRRTRNRIVSLVLYLVVMALSVSVLSGIVFAYETPNTANEVMLVVDTSYSNKESQDTKNEFVRSVIKANDWSFQIGIVTFAKEPNYVAELNTDGDAVYEQYIKSLNSENRKDDSGTDIAAALNYALAQFKKPETAKIVLITDGIETDGSAVTAITAIAAKGTKVDTVCFPNKHDKDVQVIGIELPDYSIAKNTTVKIGVTVQSSYSGEIFITLYDNGDHDVPVKKPLIAGIEKFQLDHTFTELGVHELRVEITSEGDTRPQNNTYYSYLYLGTFDSILIVDKNNESAKLEALIDSEGYNYRVVNVNDVPRRLDDLIQWHQIILVNIANSDMWTGMDILLKSYVQRGGGLLTIGGNKSVPDGNGGQKTVANVYNHDEMYKDGKPTVYQEMLPVDCVEYTPSLALMFIIDISGSMDIASGVGTKTRLDLAKDGANACIDALNPRDYCGVISFNDHASVVMPLTPASRSNSIKRAVSDMKAIGGTLYNEAVIMAGNALQAISNIDKKHIMFITDGDPNETADQYELFLEPIKRYRENGITLSTVGITGITDTGKNVLGQMASEEYGGGKCYTPSNMADLEDILRRDLQIPAVTDFLPEKFTPTIKHHTNVIKDIKGLPSLDGIYGAKEKVGVETPLMGKNSPLYSQWKYGEGRVGSFMCDLNGSETDGWSYAFWNDENENGFKNGVQIVKNIIAGLFPTKTLEPQDVSIKFLEPRNYKVTTEIKTLAENGETVSVTVKDPSGKTNTKPITVTKSGVDFFRCTIELYEPGIYEVQVKKLTSGGSEMGTYTTHTAFSYSSEYSVFLDEKKDAPETLLAKIAKEGKGAVVSTDEPEAVFKNLKPSTAHTFDPRLIFIITAIALFLLDVAARKFKFKWPHEIVRDYKIKKELEAGKK